MTTEPLHAKYVAALAQLPPWRCGRLDLNTYLPAPVQVGRVCSDVVRYVYFEDGREAVVVGQLADEVAFAAAQYRDLLTEVERLRTENVRLLKFANEATALDCACVSGDCPHMDKADCRAAMEALLRETAGDARAALRGEEAPHGG